MKTTPSEEMLKRQDNIDAICNSYMDMDMSFLCIFFFFGGVGGNKKLFVVFVCVVSPFSSLIVVADHMYLAVTNKTSSEAPWGYS